MLRGIEFTSASGKRHTERDWGLLLLNAPEISPPEPNTEFVNIPGSNGALDMTDALLGYPTYGNRQIKMELTSLMPRRKWEEVYADIIGFIHGKKLQIAYDGDIVDFRTYYFVGRCKVEEWASSRLSGRVVISADCEPYRYCVCPDTYDATISSSGTISVRGYQMPVCPLILVSSSSSLKISTDGVTYHDLADGYNREPHIVITEGNNTLYFTGSGRVQFEIREGRL